MLAGNRAGAGVGSGSAAVGPTTPEQAGSGVISDSYQHVVSLGRGCQPAHQIRRIAERSTACPFGWILTTDKGLVELIASDLEGFFARETLRRGADGYMLDPRNATRFQHEFPPGSDFDVQYALHASRFEMLVARWRELLRSEQSVLFVRQHGWDADARACAARLRDAIRGQAPRLRFSILYLTGDAADEVPWDEQGIVNHRLPQPEPYDWKGDDAAWERLLGDALRVAPGGDTANG
jgi:hypothetical protein